jgi:hypothetical protein
MIFTFFILLISLSLSISLETHHNSEQHIRILKRKVTSKFKNIVLIIADDLGSKNFIKYLILINSELYGIKKAGLTLAMHKPKVMI